MSDLTSSITPTRFNHLRGPIITLGADEGDVTVSFDVITRGSG